MSIRIFNAGLLANVFNGLLAHRDRSYIAVQILDKWHNPHAIEADYILATHAMPSAVAGEDVTAVDEQPDFPRNVTAVADAAQTAHIIVTGLDIHGDEIEEELTLNGTTTVTGSKAFASISNIHLNQRSGAANITVGIGNKLGLLAAPLAFAPEGLVDGVLEGTAPTLDATNATVVFNTALAATKDYVLKYWASEIL